MTTYVPEGGRAKGWWILPVLTIILAIVGFVAVYSMIKVTTLESASIEIICKGREARLRLPAETPYERYQRDVAIKDKETCK